MDREALERISISASGGMAYSATRLAPVNQELALLGSLSRILSQFKCWVLNVVVKFTSH